MIPAAFKTIFAVIKRSLAIWSTPDAFSRADLFWYVVVNTGIVLILVSLTAFPFASFTGAPVWKHLIGSALIATPPSMVLMYLGGNGLRVNLDLRTEVEQMRAELLAQANQDFLTGLANRRAYESAIDRKFTARDASFAVMMIDLDGFKAVNDDYGHDAGDSVLVCIGDRLRGWLEGEDALIARLGGDEFAVLIEIEEGREALNVERLARKVCHYLQMPHGYKGHDLEIGASIGLAHACPQIETASALTIAADTALRAAKAAGKGQVKTYQPRSAHQLAVRRA